MIAKRVNGSLLIPLGIENISTMVGLGFCCCTERKIQPRLGLLLRVVVQMRCKFFAVLLRLFNFIHLQIGGCNALQEFVTLGLAEIYR